MVSGKRAWKGFPEEACGVPGSGCFGEIFGGKKEGPETRCPPSSQRSLSGMNVAAFTSPLWSPGPCRVWAAGCGSNMTGRTPGCGPL